VLALSAKSETALVNLAARYRDLTGADADASPADICFSAGTGRSHFRHRLAVVGGTNQEISEALAGFVKGVPGEAVAAGEASGDGSVVFLFTGQGPQRVGMARSLYEAQPTFRRALERCDELMRPLLEVPLLSVLYPEDPDSTLINETTYAQPAMFAVQYAMAEMWRSWGVEPAAVLGHSFGEYVAACAAGAMSLEDAVTLVVERARLMNSLADTGAMAAVFAPELDVAMEIADYEDRVSVAAVNGPAHTVISGEREMVDELCAAFERDGVRTKRLRITTSSHSPLIEPILEPLRRAAEKVAFRPPRVPLMSNLTGQLWPWDEAPDADYWCRHARQPVRFAAGIGGLLAMGYRDFVEMGPAPILLGLIGDGVPTGPDTQLLPSLRPKHDDWRVLLSSLARLYANGVDIDWNGFDRDYRRTRVPVPTYAFDKTPCWRDLRVHDADTASAWDGAAEDAEPDDFSDDDLLYEVGWRPADTSASTDQEPAAPSTWLVLADGLGVGDELADELARRGIRCVRVVPGTAYHRDGQEAQVRLDGPDDLIRLVNELELGPDEQLQVVHLWGLRDPASEPDSVERALREQEDGCMSAVRAVQALAAARSTKPTRLWLVTAGAVPAGRSEADG
ncbi:MAG: acyltransferase domain-containing protein, partial [Actinomadura rubrobrunea]|nr:acyltransferase domain-containing protein [Actinomadura rubrobrunea]